jgi:hypothetical protein
VFLCHWNMRKILALFFVSLFFFLTVAIWSPFISTSWYGARAYADRLAFTKPMFSILWFLPFHPPSIYTNLTLEHFFFYF